MAKKKTVTKKENLPALTEAGLNSSALAAHANYDLAQFEGVKLDVNENKELFQNDILIPKLHLIQAMSELRKQKKADEGDFVDSLTGEIISPDGEELKFVVLKTFKRWHTFKLVNEGTKTKKEFISSEIMVLGKNENLAYQETVEGEQIVRRQVISAYVLTEKDVLNVLDKPYIIDFAGASKYAGRKMISDINTLGKNSLPSFVGFFKLTAHEENFEDGSAYVKNVAFGGYLPKEIMPFLVNCYKNLETIENQIEIDDSDVIESTASKKEDEDVTKKVATTDAGI